MAEGEWVILVIIGMVFFILGILALLWGRREEKRIFAALSEKRDLREFTQKHVESPQPGSLKMGGWIALAMGVLLGVAGFIMWLVT